VFELDSIDQNRLTPNGKPMTWDDIPFGFALATGLGAYYYLNEDGSLVPLAVVGALTKGGRELAVKTLNEVYDETLRRRGYLIENGLSDNHSSVKQLDKALGAIEKERNKLNSSFKEGEIPPTTAASDLSTSIKQAKAAGKTFDEWVKGQGTPMYHGTTAEKFVANENIHIGTKAQATQRNKWTLENEEVNPETGLDYAGYKHTPQVVEVYADIKNPYLMKDPGTQNWDIEELQRIRDMGYDSVKHKNTVEGDGFSYIVFDPKNIKTRDQLTSEWERVKPERSPLNQLNSPTVIR
jgi:hypothetical protein